MYVGIISVPFAGKVTCFQIVASMATRASCQELVEYQEEFKNLPGVLNYHTATPYVRWCIDGSRGKEWQKYMSYSLNS